MNDQTVMYKPDDGDLKESEKDDPNTNNILK